MKKLIVLLAIGLSLVGCVVSGVSVETELGTLTMRDNKVSGELDVEGSTLYIEDNKVVAIELPTAIIEVK